MIGLKFFCFCCIFFIKLNSAVRFDPDGFENICKEEMGGKKRSGCLQSSLCTRKHHGPSVDCKTQLLGSSDSLLQGNCSVLHYQTNSDACHDKEFPDVSESNAELGDFKLKPYYCYFCTLSDFAAFDVIMSNIQWNNLSFRFEAKAAIQKNHCRDILITPTTPLSNSSSLSYNCLWTDTEINYADVTYEFQYQAYNGSSMMIGKYVFDVPYADLVSPEVKLWKWKPFTYVEIKNHQLVLHIVEAPQHFDITGYTIKAFHEGLNDKISTPLVNVTKEFESDEVTYKIETNFTEGKYYFVVTALSEKCENGLCNSVQTPKITVIYPRNMYICIASAAAVVCGMVACGIIILKRFYMRGHDEDNQDSLMYDEGKYHKVLINYTRVNQKHFETVQNLVKCLRAYGLKVSYDEDIDDTDFRDPSSWCEYEIANADSYIKVTSPQSQPALAPIGVYRRVDVLLQNLFINEYTRRNLLSMNLSFEYQVGIVSKHNSAFINKFRKANDFSLPKEWKLMMKYICKHGKVNLDLNETESRKKLLDDLFLSIKQYQD